MEMCHTTQTDLALAFWPLSADIHTCMCVVYISHGYYSSTAFTSFRASDCMCGYYLRMRLVYLLKYSCKVDPSLVPRCLKNWREYLVPHWYTLFTYPLGKTFYQVSTIWLGWMLLLSCNSPPLRVMTLVLQWYMIVQHGDVYSSFQVPQKTWGAAHAWTVCTRHSLWFFAHLGTKLALRIYYCSLCTKTTLSPSHLLCVIKVSSTTFT